MTFLERRFFSDVDIGQLSSIIPDLVSWNII